MENRFKISQILKIIVAPIIMMSFMSLYTVIDGAFVSRFVGTDALSAVNIAYPYVNVILGISVMLGAGGCALVMKKVGEGKNDEARRDFSLIILFAFILSIVITIFSIIFIENIVKGLGGIGNLYSFTKEYLFYMIVFVMPTILKFIVEQFLIAINKSKVALFLSVIGGILNIVLDYVFIIELKFGVKGAGIATGIGYAVPAIIGLFFFIKKDSILYFTKPSKDMKIILSSSYNGCSEMVSQLSSGVITYLFNMVMLKHLGDDGVAAITIILYIQFLVTAVFLGYSIGVAPRISFFYGNKDEYMLKSIVSASFKILTVISVIISLIIVVLSPTLIMFFAEKGTNVFDLTLVGLRIYTISFLMIGYNIFLSGMFTAFSNGKVSTIITFLRTFIFESFGVVIFSYIFDIQYVWYAIPLARFLGVLVCIYYYKKYRSVYNY